MAQNSNIEWTDHTFNPWEGCQKVGPGCDHCYAEARNARFSGGHAVNWGPYAPRRRTSAANWRKPVTWNAAHAEFFSLHGRRQRVFCASLSDVFDNAADPAWRCELATLILATPNLDWLLLTKRIGNAGKMLAAMFQDGMPDNVWLGATVVNQEEADRDIPKLLAMPARVRFLSMEPLLGAVDIRDYLAPSFPNYAGFEQGAHMEVGYCGHCAGHADDPIHDPMLRDVIDWVIVGGESGGHARPMRAEWAQDLRDQCQAARVPFFFKQWGEWLSTLKASPSGSTSERAQRVGKKVAGRLLDGRHWDDAPTARATRQSP